MKILIAGDFCPRDRVASLITKGDYSFFDGVKDVVRASDYSIVNFECPVVEGDAIPIVKCGPALRTERKAVDAIKYAGFNCVTLANNHFRDFGSEGCESTIKALKKRDVDYVGGGMNLAEAQQVLYKVIQDKKIAIVNFCENEFSIATTTTAGAAPMDTVDNYHQIIEARKNADYVLVIVHGGHEHYQLPSPRMKKLYRYYVELGADAVVNHHQHCYSGYEYYNGKPIVYGLGNFCFDENRNGGNPIWSEGYVVILSILDAELKVRLVPYIQCGDLASVEIIQGKKMADFCSNVNKLNAIIADDIQLQRGFEAWIDKNRKYITTIFSTWHNRYLNAAAVRGWIPDLTSTKEYVAMFNHIYCESHRDIIISVLKDKMYQK